MDREILNNSLTNRGIAFSEEPLEESIRARMYKPEYGPL